MDVDSAEEPNPTPEDEEDSNNVALRGLMILPPRQNHCNDADPRIANKPIPVLLLPPIRAEEPVQSIRGALAEVVGLAQLTNYRLELEDAPSHSLPWKPDLVSSYMRADAVVCIPASIKALDEGAGFTGYKHVLEEWGDLTSLLPLGLKSGSAFRIVLQRYDSGSVKDHLIRLRSLLNGNAPASKALVEEDDDVKEEKEEVTESDGDKKKPVPSLPDFRKAESRNLRDFFYFANGQDPNLYHGKESKAKKKKKAKPTNGKDATEETVVELSVEQEMREKIPRWNELDELCNVNAQVHYSGFHPPSSPRKLIGDIAYMELILDDGSAPVHVTAVRTGFYVNRSSTALDKPRVFDPAPATEHCFSHSLLDCLLQASPAFRENWSKALEASLERASLVNALNISSPFLSLFRTAVRADFGGFSSPASATTTAQAFDATISRTTWLVSMPRQSATNEDDATAWTLNQFHSYEPMRAEDELMNTFGVDLRAGGIRDWNEELQLAREMPTGTRQERIERARLLHKVMTEFGEASLHGVKAIMNGHVTPMNPNETMRTQVYLHNNIFFSRAVDAGPETFKVARGDRAAKKAVARDLQCISIFHRSERLNISTLATLLIDYLGHRFVCQSILPGILIGERAHKLLMGSVEAGPTLKYDKDLHTFLEDKMGETMMIATRPVLRNPLTKERMVEVEQYKKQMPHLPEPIKEKPEPETTDPNAVMMSCMPIEAKAILGADKRRYLIEFGRLSPRDANWVSKDKGGTGNWEAARKDGKSSTAIPSKLDDEEWTLCLLRPELVSKYTQVEMGKFIRDQREREGNSDGETDSSVNVEEGKKLNDAALAKLKSLRLNVNVFLPHIRSFQGVNDEAAEQVKQDEQQVREISTFLWNEVLPKITRAVREGNMHQLPLDGQALTEFLHRNGVNCRYLGRLAVLAKQEEDVDASKADDIKQGRFTVIERRTMAKCWLELIECEIVARAAKHVLDAYLVEHGGVAAAFPAQTIASFLSALVSESEETAAQTETRLEKRGAGVPDEDDFGALTISETGGDGDAVPPLVRSRFEVWQDVELEVGRRFRYSLTLFNTGNNKSGRATYVPLLRRLCQRAGIRLVAKTYDVGGKCSCSGGNMSGGRLSGSYPISPLDIVDVIPLMKHMAAYNEGSFPCSLNPVTLPPLQVSLSDARVSLENAHRQVSQRALNNGLELASLAMNLYQKVTDSPFHPGIVESLELMAMIFHEANESTTGAFHNERALGLMIQNGGFDSPSVVNAHLALFQMRISAGQIDRSMTHLNAAIYLTEVMAGPNHTEAFTGYHKLGSAYSHADFGGRYLNFALQAIEEAKKRDANDRLMEGLTARNLAKILSGLGDYKNAVEHEKQALKTLVLFLGRDHDLSKESDEALNLYTKLAVEKGNKATENDKIKAEAAKADAMASILADEEEKSKGAKKNKKKKGKK